MALLEVDKVDAFYGDFQALSGISLTIEAGQVVSVIGANGAGKSTLLKSIVGLIKTAPNSVRFDGQPIGNLRTPNVVAHGITMVPEGRRLFPSLSVEENLMIGGQLGRAGPWSIQRVYDLFPVLRERREQNSMSLSGGQQQMVAIGRALMSNPRLLLCDEISLGLAPILIREIFQRLPSIVAEGTTVIVVEQDVMQALAASDAVYCLQEGHISLEGPSHSLDREAVRAAYFGA